MGRSCVAYPAVGEVTMPRMPHRRNYPEYPRFRHWAEHLSTMRDQYDTTCLVFFDEWTGRDVPASRYDDPAHPADAITVDGKHVCTVQTVHAHEEE